ncbi:MAG TPA: class I SAM-dependent methyltransferase [Phycisphaerae bacterium]|nr:class I SAM-dependent methyltransferase [Phycisphaerae bacterium]
MSRWGDQTQRYFDRIASRSGEGPGLNVSKWQVIEPLMDAVPRGGGIVECGAGTGMYTVQMLSHGYRVTAVDLSAESLKVNRRVAGSLGLEGGLRTVHGPFQEFARRHAAEFDAATFFKVLHHFRTSVPSSRGSPPRTAPSGRGECWSAWNPTGTAPSGARACWLADDTAPGASPSG